MAKNGVSYKDLYEIINEFRHETNTRLDELNAKFDLFHKEEFEPMLAWKNNLMGKIAILGGLGLLVFHTLWDLIKDKVLALGR